MKKLITFIATGLALVVGTSPVFAGDVDVEISGNGAKSNNSVSVHMSRSTHASQYNSSRVSNSVGITANTGGNRANGNTGGDVSIDTGDIDSEVVIENGGNTNILSSGDCGCEGGDLDVKIEDNGARSRNRVRLSSRSYDSKRQSNRSSVYNRVYEYLKTGYNRAGHNTNGDTEVKTGDIDSLVDIFNQGNNSVLE